MKGINYETRTYAIFVEFVLGLFPFV